MSAKRRADSHFALTHSSAHQNQVRYVYTGQQKHHGGEAQEQRGHHVQNRDARTNAAKYGDNERLLDVGVLPGDVAGHYIQLRGCLLQRDAGAQTSMDGQASVLPAIQRIRGSSLDGQLR